MNIAQMSMSCSVVMDKVAVIAVAPREAVDGGRAVSAIASAHPSALV